MDLGLNQQTKYEAEKSKQVGHWHKSGSGGHFNSIGQQERQSPGHNADKICSENYTFK